MLYVIIHHTDYNDALLDVWYVQYVGSLSKGRAEVLSKSYLMWTLMQHQAKLLHEADGGLGGYSAEHVHSASSDSARYQTSKLILPLFHVVTVEGQAVTEISRARRLRRQSWTTPVKQQLNTQME